MSRILKMQLVKRIITKALSLLEKPVKRTNWYKSQCIDPDNYPTNEWYRKHDERNYDIVNIGSSSALYAFDYKNTGLKGFNWALKPQSMEYGFKILKNFYSILGPKGIVTIPLCPFSGLSVPDGKWAQSRIERYCDILDPSLIENYKTISFHHSHPLISKPKESIKRLIKDTPQNDNTAKCKNSTEFESDAENWIKIWKKEFAIENLSDPLSDENKKGMKERQNLVNEIINFCLDRDLQPVIISTPVHESLAKHLTPEFCKNYLHNFIAGINLQGTHYIHWINPKEDCPIQFDSSDFHNSFFLNEKGAEKFSSIFIKQLREYGYFDKDDIKK